MRKRVYIAGPMSLGDRIVNLDMALRAYRALLEKGYAPLCPQLTFFVDRLFDFPWQTWIDADLPWVSVSDAVLRLPGKSDGAERETATASKEGIPVFYCLSDLYSRLPA